MEKNVSEKKNDKILSTHDCQLSNNPFAIGNGHGDTCSNPGPG